MPTKPGTDQKPKPPEGTSASSAPLPSTDQPTPGAATGSAEGAAGSTADGAATGAGAGATGSGADAPAVGASPPPPPPPPPVVAPTHRRLLCAIEGASTSISGIAFATVEIDGQVLHLSARLPVERAEQLARIPGLSLWNGDEAAHARAIEDALDKSRAIAPAAGMSRPADQHLVRDLDEARRANLAMADELRELRQRADRLATENDQLRQENAALKGAGHTV